MANSRVVLSTLCCLVLAACDRGANTAGPSCETAAGQIVATLSNGEKSVSAMEAKGAVVKTCTDTKWPEPARTCLAKAQSRDELKKCTHDTLTGLQGDKLQDATSNISSISTKAALKKMADFADMMCACKDAKCAQDVSDEMTKWGQEMAKQRQDPPKMSEDDIKKATDIGQRMGECMQKALTADLPTGSGEGDRTPDGRVISK